MPCTTTYGEESVNELEWNEESVVLTDCGKSILFSKLKCEDTAKVPPRKWPMQVRALELQLH